MLARKKEETRRRKSQADLAQIKGAKFNERNMLSLFPTPPSCESFNIVCLPSLVRVQWEEIEGSDEEQITADQDGPLEVVCYALNGDVIYYHHTHDDGKEAEGVEEQRQRILRHSLMYLIHRGNHLS